MKRHLFYILFISAFLTGCDPGQMLVFVNKTESDAFVSIKKHTDSTEVFTINKIALEELDSVIVIKPQKSYEISFGIGTWSYEKMEDVSRIVKEIKIESESKTVIYNSGKQIEELMKSNRRASIGSVKINIEIN